MQKILDLNQWSEEVEELTFSSNQITLIVHKASDIEILPGKNKEYNWVYPVQGNWDKQNHADPYFRERFDIYRSRGLLYAGYHNVGFIHPRSASENEIAIRNHIYFENAINGLLSKTDRPFLNFEQIPNLDPLIVNTITKKILTLYQSQYMYAPVVMTNKSWAQQYMLIDEENAQFFTQFPLWITDTRPFVRTPNLPSFGKYTWDYIFWQKERNPNISVINENKINDLRKAIVPSQELPGNKDRQ